MTAAEIANANVAVLFERSAARRGNAAAVVAPDGRVLWTFEGLAEASARLAGGLVGLGLGKGDRVLVLEPDRRELYRVVSAVIWAGASVLLPPVSMPLLRALDVVAASRPRAVVASLPLWPVALAYSGLRNAPIRVASGRWRFLGAARVQALSRHQPIAPRAVSAESPALTSFTTGTTGPSKAVTRSHGVLHAQHDALAALRVLREVDRDFAGLPMLVLHNLASGVTSILAPRGPGSAQYGPRIRDALVRARATSAAGFPHLFESAVHGARDGELDRLGSIYVGGNRVPPALLTALTRVAPGARITIVYGSTEVEPIAAIEADQYLDLLARSEPAEGTCVGTVLDGLELQVEPLAEPSAGSPSGGASGRILVRGARASQGAGTGEWVDTGDAGRVDDDGRLWLLGRSANAVGSLYPAHVERVIEALPWVDRAALVRVESGTRGLALLAVQPFHWGTPDVRAEHHLRLTSLAKERGWALDDILQLRRLPLSIGAAAKIDYDRLMKLASTRSQRASPEPGSARL